MPGCRRGNGELWVEGGGVDWKYGSGLQAGSDMYAKRKSVVQRRVLILLL